MKKLWYVLFVLFCFSACSDKTPAGDSLVIDVVNSVGKYQRVYASDYFSSIELIPLETNDDGLVAYWGVFISIKYLFSNHSILYQ